MDIYNQGIFDYSKPTIFLDIDDVILLSSKTVAKILKNKYPNQTKELSELKDWEFKSINREISKELLGQIFDSEEFFNTVEFNNSLISILEKTDNDTDGLFNSYNWVLVTKGSETNLQEKYKLVFNHPFFKKHKLEIGYYGLNMNESKSKIRMLSGIQIDDNYWNLVDTDASLKILLKNNLDTNYNSIYQIKNNLQNLYIANDMKEVIQILQFIKICENKEIDFLEDMEISISDF